MIFDTSSRPEAAPTFSQPQGPEGGSRLSAANGRSQLNGERANVEATSTEGTNLLSPEGAT